ncbi:GNAT family N-acetyltransferase [Aspergillus stella-maris]|uniref:GNAT family N-acetyltransferase n=1 Tax=Aspergillus stella-maris TaxID=1810926 RepID=UPI003CCCCC98
MKQDPPAISPSTAHLLEAAEAASLKNHVECLRQFANEAGDKDIRGYITKSIGGGIAARTTPLHGRKMNRVVGIGMDGPVMVKDIQSIESLYAGINMTPTIVVASGFADPGLREILLVRGYAVSMAVPIHYLALHDDREIQPAMTTIGEACGEIAIDRVGEDQRKSFIRASAAGFAPKYPDSDLPYAQALSAAHRPDTTVYIARINGEFAGTAAVALIDTGIGKVANLYFDSTLPAFQGRGVQMALIRTRLNDAKCAGADYATASTWPVGSSARNFAKAGFRVGYQKKFWTLA